MSAPSTVSRRVAVHSVKPWLTAAIALFAVAWGGNEFTPLLVMYRLREHLPAFTVDLLLGAYVVGIIPGLLLGGPLSDRLGRRRLMLPAPLLAAIGSITLALGASDPWVLGAGRIFSGVALGVVMAVGTSWIKELSSAPFDLDASADTGARRAAMSLTAGFGLGAVVAAMLSQFGPAPEQTPYVVNVALCLLAFVALRGAPETRRAQQTPGPLLDDLRIPAAGHRRFLYVVAPTAPWVFGTAASAYAILPSLLSSQVHGLAVGFAGLMCLVALGVGVWVQSVARRFDRPGTSRGLAVGMAVTVPAMALAAAAAMTGSILVAIAAAALLGAAYGLLLVGGLQEVQRISGPQDLAGVTAAYYSLSYLGFFVPAALAQLDVLVGYPALFMVGSILALGCLLVVLRGSTRHLPAAQTPQASHAVASVGTR